MYSTDPISQKKKKKSITHYTLSNLPAIFLKKSTNKYQDKLTT